MQALMQGKMDGRVDGWMDGWMDEGMAVKLPRFTCPLEFYCSQCIHNTVATVESEAVSAVMQREQ